MDMDLDELHYAAATGNVTEVVRLLQAGVSVDGRDGGLTALHVACMMCFPDCTRELLEANADVDALDDRNATPLQYASLTGDLECVKILVHAGARLDLKNQGGYTARDVATHRSLRVWATSLFGKTAIQKYLDGVTEFHCTRRAQWEAARQAPQEAENKAAAAATAGDAMSDAALAAVQPAGRRSLGLGAIRVPPSARPSAPPPPVALSGAPSHSAQSSEEHRDAMHRDAMEQKMGRRATAAHEAAAKGAADITAARAAARAAAAKGGTRASVAKAAPQRRSVRLEPVEVVVRPRYSPGGRLLLCCCPWRREVARAPLVESSLHPPPVDPRLNRDKSAEELEDAYIAAAVRRATNA